jgi:hypothetical protein
LKYPVISAGYGLMTLILNRIPKYGTVGEERVYVIELLLHIVSLLIDPVTLAVGSTNMVIVVSMP